MTLVVNKDTLPLLMGSLWSLPQIIERAFQIESKIKPDTGKMATLSNPHIILAWFIEQELVQARFKIVLDHAKATGIQRYVQSHARAILEAYSLTTSLSTDPKTIMKDIFRIHDCFPRMGSEAGPPRLRNTELWIGPRERGQAGAFLLPLPASQIESYLEDLILFQAHSDLPVILKSAIFYTQFLMIHPFSDSNGRTARTTTSILLNKYLKINPMVFSCSHLFEKKQFEYIRTSHEILISGNWIPYLCLFMDIVEECIGDLNTIVESLGQIDEEIRTLSLTSHFRTSIARRVLFELLKCGECSYKKLKKTLRVHTHEYQFVLKELSQLGLIKSTKSSVQSTRLASLLWGKNWKDEIETLNREEHPAGLVPVSYNPI